VSVEMVSSTFMGLLGGVANVILWAQDWNDLKQFKSFRQIVIGGIVGFVYTYLHSEYAFPNMVMAFVAGYMGTDALQGIIERFKK